MLTLTLPLTHDRIFTVDRRTWYRGKGGLSSALLREDGRRCCLGHVAQQCGIPDNTILLKDTPRDAPSRLWPIGFVVLDDYNSDLVREAIHTNDNSEIPAKEREARLQSIFRRANIELVFIN